MGIGVKGKRKMKKKVRGNSDQRERMALEDRIS